jgi:hypothetical protein
VGARILWLLLAPALAGGGFLNLINIAFTCEGRYGDDASDEACEWIGEGAVYELLVFGGWFPLVVWVVGAGLWSRPKWLSWFNGILVMLGGAVLVGISLLISTGGVAVLFGLAWFVAAVVAGAGIFGTLG